MPISAPPPFPNFFKKKRPPSLNLTSKTRSSTSSSSSSERFLPSAPQSTCATPKIKAFLSHLNFEEIEDLITYNPNNLKNGQNGIVKEVSLSVKKEIHKLIRKQGSFGVEQENKMTEAIQNVSVTNFPFELFALPVAKGWDGTTNILYTSYQETGDLQAHADYIYNQYITNPSSVLSYLFQGFYQLLDAINALNSSEFKDEHGKFHQGIIHNDIKPSNIFLKTNGSFILGDFGCAYFKDEAACQISTFQFSAPELFANEDFCKKSILHINSDVWSLGACFWYLLTNQLLSPILPIKPLSDIEKIFFYQDWAKNYSIQWQVLIKNHLKNLIGEDLVKQIRDTIDMSKNYIKKNWNDPQNTEKKKTILKNLALLMLAPACERPKAQELESLMKDLYGCLVMEGELKCFATQLLERKKEKNQDYNNNKSTFSR